MSQLSLKARSPRTDAHSASLGPRASAYIGLGLGLVTALSVVVLSAASDKGLQALVGGAFFGCLLAISSARGQFLVVTLAFFLVFNVDVFLFRESFVAIADFHGIPGLQVSAAHVVVVMLFVRWLITGKPRLEASPSLHLLTLLFGLVCLAVVASTDRRASLLEGYRILLILGMSYFVNSSLPSGEAVLMVCKALVLSLLAESLVVFAQHAGLLSGGSSLFGEVGVVVHEMGRSEIVRPTGTYGHPDKLAVQLMLLVPLAASMGLAARKKMSQLVYGGCFVAGLAALFLSGARAAWLGVALGLLTQFLLVARQRTLRARLLKMGLLALLIIGMFAPSTLIPRMTESDSGSAYSRLPMAKNAWELVKRYPWLGTGPANYPMESWRYAPGDLHESMLGWPVHSMYLLVASECGIPVLFSLCLFVALIFRRSVARNSRLPTGIMVTKYGLGGSVVGFVVASAFNGHYLGEELLFFFLCQVIIVTDRVASPGLTAQGCPQHDSPRANWPVGCGSRQRTTVSGLV